jgi:hypothetical protein
LARGTAAYTWGTGGANYKACYQAISGVINQALVKTADTGQVNWATVSTEPGSGVIRDYEVFALGGPLQATAPIFIRIDYWGTSTAGNGVQITVGTTTDGAGNLGGLLVTRAPLQNHLLAASPNQYCWAASDQASYFTFLYALDPAATGTDGVGMAVIERTRDPDGTATNAGFHAWRWQASTATNAVPLGGWAKTFGAGSQPAAADFNYNVMAPDLYNLNTGAVSGGIFYAFPAHTYTPPFTMKGASKALMFAFAADFPRGVATPITHYGESMTFLPLADALTPNIPIVNSGGSGTHKQMSALIRWD